MIDREPAPRAPLRLASCAGVTRRLVLAAPAIVASASSVRGETIERVVAAGGAITEIIYALGASDVLVGVDSTSLFPETALKTHANVGYVRTLSPEGILSLKPTRVIATEGAGPPTALKLLTDAGVRVDMVPEAHTPDGVLARLSQVGSLVGAGPAAERLRAETGQRFAALARARATVGAPRRVLFLLSLQNGRPLVGGRKTSADAMIRLAGAHNAAEAIDGFKPMSDEAVVAAAPETIVMMSRGAHAVSGDSLFALAAFANTPAATARRLIVMDGLYLLRFGPRTPHAAFDLMSEVYHDMQFVPLAPRSE